MAPQPNNMFEEENFAYASFAFAAVTGFCIGGTALANVIGIPYINKSLSLTNSVNIYTLYNLVIDICLLRNYRECSLIKIYTLLNSYAYNI